MESEGKMLNVPFDCIPVSQVGQVYKCLCVCVYTYGPYLTHYLIDLLVRVVRSF